MWIYDHIQILNGGTWRKLKNKFGSANKYKYKKT